MELLGMWFLCAIVVFVINAVIIRFMVGTDRIMHYQRKQIQLLEKLLEYCEAEIEDAEYEEPEE